MRVSLHKKDRLLWPDAAKGFSIILVVLAHLTSKHYFEVISDLPDVLKVFWLALTDFLTPIRMPLFFAISGFFVAASIARPWAAVARKRVLSIYYLYVVWYVIHSLFFAFEFPLRTSLPSGPWEQALGFVWGFTSLWYLYALPVYFLICKLLVRFKVQALVGAGVLSIISATPLVPDLGNTYSVLGNLVFFMAAAYYPNAFSRVAKDSRKHAVGWIGAFSVVSGAVTLVTFFLIYKQVSMDGMLLSLGFGVIGVPLGFLGIVAGVKASGELARRFGRVSQGLAFLGTRTLPVYVLHLLVLAVMNSLVGEMSVPLVVMILYPVVALAVVIVVCLGIHRAAMLMRLNFLFALPGTPAKAATPAGAWVGPSSS